MKNLVYIAALGMTLSMASCDGLDQYPTIDDSTDKVYSSAEGCQSALAACYASFSYNVANLSMKGKNEPLIRSVFNLQEGTTDAVAFTWLSGDQLDPLTYNTWSASDVWCQYVWYRCYVVVTSCNDIIQHLTADDEESKQMVLEARFLKSLALSYIMDLFGKGVLPDVDHKIGDSDLPEVSRKDLYAFVTSELEDIAPLLKSDVAYPRANKGAAYALLSRIYLNSEVYNGTKDFDKCIKAAQSCKAEGYALEPKETYQQLFGADNDKHAGKGKEIIFALYTDPQYARSWAGATNLICGFAKNDNSCNELLGITGGWSNMRVNKAFSSLFSDGNDIRSSYFYKDGQTQEVSNEEDLTNGWLSTKFTNLHDDGSAAIYKESTNDNGCATDLPILRLAEVILNEAEANFRLGKTSEALELVNQIRERVGAEAFGELTEQDILAERGRELAFEALRRTDLIRFNKFAGDVDYNWEFKGGVAAGKNIEAFRNLFPIPADELSANANLTQNPGY